MATVKITDKQSTESVKSNASVLVTQPETAGGATKESLRRATLAAFIKALRDNGINEGYKTADDIEAMYPDLVKSVDTIETGIRITFWDDTSTDIEIKSGGLAFDAISYDQSSGYLHITMNGEDVVDPCFIGGGGGSGGTSTVVKLENLTGSASLTVAHGESVNISFSYYDYDSAGEFTNSSGALEIIINNQTVLAKNIAQGNHTIDIGSYLSEGTNKVKVKVTDEDDNYGTKTWTVNAVALSISATIDDTAINTGPLVFRYTPIGNNIEKTIHFLIDNEEIATATVTASGRQQTQSIPAQSHGAHRLKVYATATVDGVSVTSNTLEYDIIWAEAGNTTPIIACSFTGSATQYSTVAIPYQVYNPASLTASITLAVNGVVVSTQTVDRTRQTWNYKADTAGTDTLTITCGSVVKTITLQVASSGVDIEPITTGLTLDLNPQGHTNNDTDRASFGYTDGNGTNHPLTFSDNFDWENGGFKTDEQGGTYLCIKCGTSVTFDRSVFADDAMRNGKELKLIFKATNCRNYDAEIGSCLADGIGIKLQAQKATVSSEQTTMDAQYCEDSRIEMDINIEPDSADRIMMLWLEGIPSRVAIYEANDNFTQDTPAKLKFGSNDCDVWLYRVKAYSNSLTKNEVHENWIADAPDAEEMLDRYQRNNIYDQNGNIDIQKLINANPDLRVVEIEGPRMTTGKKDPVVGKIKHTLKSGGAAHTFVAEGISFKVQGTSSAQYGEAAYNLDVDFKNATMWQDGDGNDMTSYAMTDNSIPVKYFNIKLNVASSENANNIVMQDEYNNFQPYLNPARVANPKVRDTMEGHPCVVFFTNTSDETITVSARTLAPGETMLYGCGDWNNSKKNLEVFGQQDNPNQCCIEISNNTNNQCLFKSDDLSTEAWDGDSSFEFRYPDGGSDALKAAFQRVLSWVVSTDRTAATDANLPETKTYGGVAYTKDTAAYRGAKFVAELEDYFIKDSLLFHYLFTERHALVDNRAKNCFISTDDGIHWDFTKDYDNDTADGNDNEGGLTLTYGLEDTDQIGSKDVFNASSSVLWCNIRDLMYNDLREMYIKLESKGAWDAERILAKYKAHQSPRPEALVMEDMYKKYIQPFTNSGANAYLKMLLGTKEDQRRQFEIYQEKYIASKYRGSKATSDTITFRAYTPSTWQGVAPSSKITITPYADMYIILHSGSGIVSQRAKRNTAYELTCPIDTLNDTEIYIYSASNIVSVGDLAPLYVGYFNVAAAKKLRSLKLGDGTTGYSNTNAEVITVGNNTLLESLDIRNCPNIVQGLDLTGCGALQTLEAVGSGITGVSFARGGKIKKAHVPAISSLSAIALKDLEELTLTAYTALRTLRIENCPTINEKTIIETATGLTRIRVLGVNWTLQNTDLLDRLVALKGLDENDHNLETSVLTGAAYVPVMRQAKLAAYRAAWTDLDITYQTLVQQYLVTFKNYDGTVLHTEYVDRNEDVEDPVTAGTIATPTRESTVSTVYTYNGWDGDLTAIIAPRTLTAKYTETPRKYTVKWYSTVGIVMDTQTVDYGSEAIYAGETPERTDEEAQAIYYLFKGWDKSTGYIKGDTEVWAVWERGELPNTGTQLKDMNAAQINAVIKSGNAANYFSLKDRVAITLGFNPAYNNVEYTDICTEQVLDGATCIDTGIQPFANGIADPWTLVVDLEFSEKTSEQTALCCLQEDGYMGFKVKYNGGPSIQWSTNSYNSGATTYREIMIIRHKAGSRNVVVYSSKAYTDQIDTQELTKTIDTQTNAHLYIGATVTDGGQQGNFATGVIHSCRYWKGDLGDTDCRKIVSWPRETYIFEVGNFGAYYLANNSIQKTSVDFICASILERLKQMNTTSSNAGGFSAMPLYTWMQNRLYKAFPQEWRLMMKNCTVKGNQYVDGTNGNVQSFTAYLWVPSYNEMQGNNAEPWLYEGEWVTFFTNNQTRIKFQGYALPEGYSIFTSGTDPAQNAANTIKEGDLWINTSESSRGYVRRNGAWFAAYHFWLRGASVAGATNFCFVGNYGVVSYAGHYAANTIGVCPRFSI